MKRFWTVALFALCSTSASAGQPQSDSKDLLRNAQQFSATLLAATQQGHGLVEVKQPGLAFGSVRGYDVNEVTANIQKIQSDLSNGLKRNEFGGLEAYTQTFFPKVSLKTLEVTRTPETTCSTDPCPATLAEPESVESMYRYVGEFVNKVAGATAYKVSFNVRSKPAGAVFSLQPLGGGFQTEIATNGSVGNLFRGLYRYTIARQGFKRVEATLNLVDNSPDQLYCELIDAQSKAEPLPCMFGIIE
jgi:hypothetical protein